MNILRRFVKKRVERHPNNLGRRDIPLTPAQTAELDRRLAIADDDLAESVSWETIRDELRRRVGKAEPADLLPFLDNAGTEPPPVGDECYDGREDPD